MISALSQDTIRDALTKFATFYDQHRGDMSTWQIEAWRDEHYPSLLPARLYPTPELAQERRIAVCKMLSRLPEAVGSDEADECLRIDRHARAGTDFAEAVWGVLDAFSLKVRRNAEGFLDFMEAAAVVEAVPSPEPKDSMTEEEAKDILRQRDNRAVRG